MYLGIVLMLVTWWLFASRSGGTESTMVGWGDGSSMVKALALTAAMLAGFVVGTVLASRVAWLRQVSETIAKGKKLTPPVAS